MKILHATEVLKGGVSTVISELLRDQCGRSEVSNVILVGPQQEMKEVTYAENDNTGKLELYTFSKNNRGVKTLFLFCLKFIKVYLKYKPDILHLHSSFAGSLLRVLAFLLRPIHKAKIVYCPHAFSFLMEDKSGFKLKWYKSIELFLSFLCDKIVCVSNFEKEKAVEVGIKNEKLEVICNGVNPNDSLCGGGNSTHGSDDQVNILFVGRLERQKGFDLLMDAFYPLNEARFTLTIVGDGDEKFAYNLDKRNITYMGWLNGDDLALQYKRADVVVVPSRWEGFAMVPLEAMSYGVPIIASNSTSLPEVVFPDINGYLFTSNDSDSLKMVLLNIDMVKLGTMGAKGKKLLMEKFTSSKMTEKVFNLYLALN